MPNAPSTVSLYGMVAQRYMHRCDRDKIPCRSLWVRERAAVNGNGNGAHAANGNGNGAAPALPDSAAVLRSASGD